MAETYRTRQGDMLDLIVWRRYAPPATPGAPPGPAPKGAVEQVMAANVALGAALALPILPPGLDLTLPDLAAPTADQAPAAVRLWD